MANGWVKLWRKSIDSGLIKNHNVWIFWTYCLMKANHEKDYKCVVGFQEVILQPGQFIFGRKKAAEETELSEQKIRTCLEFLKKYKNLTIKTTNKFSVITIVNWVTYQNKEDEINQQSNQHLTSRQPTLNHIQEPKNLRTKEDILLGKYKKASFIPNNYLIQPEHIKYALSKNISENIARSEFESFVSHHSAKGSLFKNWYAAYQKWIQNGIKYKSIFPDKQKKTNAELLK